MPTANHPYNSAVGLSAGARIGLYQITEMIGQGGMGEVYRARDTRLDRDVAIKIISESFAADPDRLRRFEQEARTLAALNHPHIAHIYGVEDRALVMELVEGEELSRRIARGPLPMDDALAIARQIAEGLEAAHARGVVHRDLKPANIKIDTNGRVKILDFGLAKAAPAASTDATATAATKHGAILGTPAYMSPEQARGEAAGPQSDVWALGVVLYEMLTGVSPFKRDSGMESIAAILSSAPDLTRLPADTPASARRALARALARDLSRRTHHVSDLRLDLEDAQHERTLPRIDAPAAARSGRRWIAVAAIALAGIAIGWMVSRLAVPEASPPAPIRLSMAFKGAPTVLTIGSTYLALSPDGTHVALTLSSSNLWVRDLAQQEPVLVSTGRQASNPFFSSDGQWVGFFDDQGVRKVPLNGGASVAIATTANRPSGATWHGDSIVFASTEGLHQVSSAGGDARLIKAPDRARHERLYAWPQFLPGGRSLLFTIVSDGGAPQVAWLKLDTNEQRTLIEGGSAACYDGHGALVYAVGGVLHTMRFDAASGTVSGTPQRLDVTVAASPDNGAANFAVAPDGTLVFAPPRREVDRRRLVWIDRRGALDPLPLEPQAYGLPRVSPDGKRIAVERTINGKRDIWIVDLALGTQTQLTDGPSEDMLAVWSPDGRRVWFSSDRSGNFDIYSQAADGATPARLELALPEPQFTQAFVPDGRQLLVYDRFRDTVLFDPARPGVTTPLLDSPDFDQRLAQISPDGRWIAYESDESGGRFEVFVRPFPNVKDARVQISASGGRYPLWGAPGSNELYYVTPEGAMMAVSARPSAPFTVDRVTKLFENRRPATGRSGMQYDISPIDRRFLYVLPELVGDDTTTTDLNVFLHFRPAR